MAQWQKDLNAWIKAHPGQQPPPELLNPPILATCGGSLPTGNGWYRAGLNSKRLSTADAKQVIDIL